MIRAEIIEVLPGFLRRARWFGGKSRRIVSVTVIDHIRPDPQAPFPVILILKIEYPRGSEIYLLPLSSASGEKARQIRKEFPKSILCLLPEKRMETLLYESTTDPLFRNALLNLISESRKLETDNGILSGTPGQILSAPPAGASSPLPSSFPDLEQSNSSFIYGEDLILKLYRKLGAGLNPDVELTRFLSEKAGFSYVPAFAGSIEFYPSGGSQSWSIALLQKLVPNRGDGWKWARGEVKKYFQRLREGKHPRTAIDAVFLNMIELLGKRTGQLHCALASAPDSPELKPEPLTAGYTQKLFCSLRTMTKQALGALERKLDRIPSSIQDTAESITNSGNTILEIAARVTNRDFSAQILRIHGDYHLGQILLSEPGDDFIIIDFEGEPARALSERREKQSPLKDVAGMLRSFDYAASSYLLENSESGKNNGINKIEKEGKNAGFWYQNVSDVFLKAYREATAGVPFIPSAPEDFQLLLNTFILEKAVYELKYELNNRPPWTVIPLRGLSLLLR